MLYSGSPTAGISLVFDWIDINSGWDVLTIHDGPNSASPIVAQLSGSYNQRMEFQSCNPFFYVKVRYWHVPLIAIIVWDHETIAICAVHSNCSLRLCVCGW